MSSPKPPFACLAQAVCIAVERHADELTALDQAIGDADHGINMRRGFAAVAEKIDALGAMPFGAAVAEVGKILVMTVGGASGPLYGTFFMRLGAELGATPAPKRADLARAMRRALEAVQARGKAVRGQKTMLDVLEPLVDLLDGDAPRSASDIAVCAHQAAMATVPLRAEKGRASFLGDRSRDHLDPGARSTEIIAVALAATWEDQCKEQGAT